MALRKIVGEAIIVQNLSAIFTRMPFNFYLLRTQGSVLESGGLVSWFPTA
jgi:hypothetical protein